MKSSGHGEIPYRR